MARSHKPSKMDHIKADQFFQLVSFRCNYIKEQLVKDVFYSMVKVIVQELKRTGVVRLPNFGDFVITVHKGRVMRDVKTGSLRKISSKKTIKFMVDYKLKKYFNM